MAVPPRLVAKGPQAELQQGFQLHHGLLHAQKVAHLSAQRVRAVGRVGFLFTKGLLKPWKTMISLFLPMENG